MVPWSWNWELSNEPHAHKPPSVCLQAVSNVNPTARKKSRCYGEGSKLPRANTTAPKWEARRGPPIYPKLPRRPPRALRIGLADKRGPTELIRLQRKRCMWTLSLKSKGNRKSLQQRGHKNKRGTPRGLQRGSRVGSGPSQHPEDQLVIMDHQRCPRMGSIGERTLGKKCTEGEAVEILTSAGRATCSRRATHQIPLSLRRNWKRKPK